MSKTYTPGDKRTSRYEPMIGHPILYRPPANTAHGRSELPGVITRVYKDSDRDLVDLVIFAPTGVYHVSRKPYSEDAEDADCWFWPTPLVARNLANSKLNSNVVPSSDKQPVAMNKEQLQDTKEVVGVSSSTDAT